MFRCATTYFLTALMLWHALAMSLLGADVADLQTADHQVQQQASSAQSGTPAGSLSEHYVDDQPGHFFQMQAADILIDSWPASCAVALRHLPPFPPKDVIHQSPLLDGLHRPPDEAPTAQA